MTSRLILGLRNYGISRLRNYGIILLYIKNFLFLFFKLIINNFKAIAKY